VAVRDADMRRQSQMLRHAHFYMKGGMQTLDKHQRNVRGARPDTGVRRIYRIGGHINFGQGIAGPPQLATFLLVQFEGKKVATSPNATSPKKGD
jgi:hypothetical protein